MEGSRGRDTIMRGDVGLPACPGARRTPRRGAANAVKFRYFVINASQFRLRLAYHVLPHRSQEILDHTAHDNQELMPA
jgi:hypothetical protein